jgi:hypothetical protein
MTKSFRSSLSGISDHSMSTNLFSQSNESIVSISNKKTTTTRPKHRSKANARQRGPRFTRIDKKSTPLLRRLVGTIFGDIEPSTAEQSTSKPKLPSPSTIKKQFENNEETLRSLVTLLSQIEPKESSNEQARNNNRIDDSYV